MNFPPLKSITSVAVVGTPSTALGASVVFPSASTGFQVVKGTVGDILFIITTINGATTHTAITGVTFSECDTTNGTYAAVPAGRLSGTWVEPAHTASVIDCQSFSVKSEGCPGFIRVTVAGGGVDATAVGTVVAVYGYTGQHA